MKEKQSITPFTTLAKATFHLFTWNLLKEQTQGNSEKANPSRCERRAPHSEGSYHAPSWSRPRGRRRREGSCNDCKPQRPPPPPPWPRRRNARAHRRRRRGGLRTPSSSPTPRLKQTPPPPPPKWWAILEERGHFKRGGQGEGLGRRHRHRQVEGKNGSKDCFRGVGWSIRSEIVFDCSSALGCGDVEDGGCCVLKRERCPSPTARWSLRRPGRWVRSGLVRLWWGQTRVGKRLIAGRICFV